MTFKVGQIMYFHVIASPLQMHMSHDVEGTGQCFM